MTEWTEWKPHKPGDPCPIPDAKAGEYKLRLVRLMNTSAPEYIVNETRPKISGPDKWNWGAKNYEIIIAYRTKKGQET